MHSRLERTDRRRRWRWLVVFGAISVIAAACGDSKSDSTTPGATNATGSTVPGTTAPAKVETDPTATIKIAYVGPATIDPHRTTSAHEYTYTAPVYDRLVHRSVDGKPIPGLAESWSFSADGLQLTFKLRANVKFHDGTPFNAAAVKANIERGLTFATSTVKGDLGVITSVDAVDDLTARFNLSGPAASLPLILSTVGGSIISPAAMAGDLETKPVGTGPFKLTSYTRGSRIAYERNDDYWDKGAALVKSIEFTITSDTTAQLNAMKSGQIDITTLQPGDVKDVEGLGFQITSTGGLGFMHLQMNRALKPFDDERVRQAMNYAINRDAIVKALLFGAGGVTAQPFPPGYFAYSDELKDLYKFDQAKARTLLKDAGYDNTLAFDIVTPAGPSVQVAEAIQSQLKDVGVTVKIQSVEPAQFSPTFYGTNSKVPAGVVQWTGRTDPRQTFGQLYSATGNANPGRHTTPEVTDLFAKALKPSSDKTADEAVIRAVTTQVVKQALDVPVYFYTTQYGASKRVVGMQTWASGYLDFYGIGIKK